jgi:hypothetical protein
MIHHFSIAVEQPQHVSEVLAEIFQGSSVPFPSYPDSHMLVAMDEFGTLIELYPIGTELVPGQEASEQLRFEVNIHPQRHHTATHAAISVPTSETEIEEIAEREGWRVVRCNRDGFFDVIELWIENCILLELLPPEFQSSYVNFMQPFRTKAGIDRYLAAIS